MFVFVYRFWSQLRRFFILTTSSFLPLCRPFSSHYFVVLFLAASSFWLQCRHSFDQCLVVLIYLLRHRFCYWVVPFLVNAWSFFLLYYVIVFATMSSLFWSMPGRFFYFTTSSYLLLCRHFFGQWLVVLFSLQRHRFCYCVVTFLVNAWSNNFLYYIIVFAPVSSLFWSMPGRIIFFTTSSFLLLCRHFFGQCLVE